MSAGNGRFSLDDYVDVAQRIADFTAKYPEGTLQTISWDVEEVGGQTFIVYRAAAYRTPDDQRPGMGIAWEPFPGKTPYTRDSELMNAETSAWGRAIVACGLASKKIASKQEMQGRQNGAQNDRQTDQPVAQPAKRSERPATARQRGMLNAKASEAGLSSEAFANIILVASGTEAREWTDEGAASRWLGRALDRLPAKWVDGVLEGIAAVKA